MSQGVKVCMHCRYAVEVETPEGALPLLNQQKPRQCVFSPPAPILVGVRGGGGYAVVPTYPPVNADTVSCAQFDNAAPMFGAAINRGGK